MNSVYGWVPEANRVVSGTAPDCAIDEAEGRRATLVRDKFMHQSPLLRCAELKAHLPVVQ